MTQLADLLGLYEGNDVCRDGAYFANDGALDPYCLASRISRVFTWYNYFIRYDNIRLAPNNTYPCSTLRKKPVRNGETDQEWDFKMLQWTIQEIENIQRMEYRVGCYPPCDANRLWMKKLNLKKMQRVRRLCKQLKNIYKYFKGANDVFFKVISKEANNVIVVNKEVDNKQVFPLEKNNYVEKVTAEFHDATKLYRDKYLYADSRDDMLGLLENKMPSELVRMVDEYIMG